MSIEPTTASFSVIRAAYPKHSLQRLQNPFQTKAHVYTCSRSLSLSHTHTHAHTHTIGTFPRIISDQPALNISDSQMLVVNPLSHGVEFLSVLGEMREIRKMWWAFHKLNVHLEKTIFYSESVTFLLFFPTLKMPFLLWKYGNSRWSDHFLMTYLAKLKGNIPSSSLICNWKFLLRTL